MVYVRGESVPQAPVKQKPLIKAKLCIVIFLVVEAWLWNLFYMYICLWLKTDLQESLAHDYGAL